MTIKEARKAAGLTQQNLSDMLKIPIRTLVHWEAGDRVPPEYVEQLIIDKLTQISKDQEQGI